MAQGNHLLISPIEQVRRATRAANGYTSGSFDGGRSATSPAGSPDGRVVIEVRHSEETEARIVNNSVQRAKVEVVRDISRDTSMRRAVSRVSE